MSTSPSATDLPGPGSGAVRIELRDQRQVGGVDGAWLPRSRDFRHEVAALIDHFDLIEQRVHRVLFSRPDWDDVVIDGRGLRRVLATRGPVKVGSFPRDDTHQVVLSMAGGHRLTISVIPHTSDATEARRAMQASVA